MKVLVADDSTPIRQRLVDRLKQIPGIDIFEAVDTPQALQQIDQIRPDVAVLDIRMPGGGGIKALDQIKKQHPSVTVIIMTNYPYAQYRRKCLDAGADFFFDKSTEFEQISETVRNMMESGVDSVARRTAAAQLVEAKEALEKMEQRQKDLSLLSLFHTHAAPEALKEAHTMWEMTFDAIPDMIALLDTDHCIIRVNKALADRLDMPATELTGKKCFQFFHGTICPVAGCPHEQMLKDSTGHEVEFYEAHIGCWLSVSVTPVKAGDRLVGAIHIARDITERKTSEQLIQESEQRYRGLFKSMHAGFALHKIICDEHGNPCDYRFIEVNPAFEQLTGLKADQLVGKTVKDVIPATEAYWIETYGRVALTGTPAQIDNFSSSLGRHYSVSAYSPCKGQFATVFTDITEQKNAEEIVRRARNAAEEANRAKTQLLANMSHELRTPLNAIIGLTELLGISPLSEEQADYVDTISNSGEALLSLISDLLDFSKIEMGKLEVKKTPVLVREVVEKSTALLSRQAADKGISLIISIADDIPAQVVGDAVRLQQVLVNLLNNALKFTEEGFVKLTVACRETLSGSRRIEFSVEDSGEGMSDATLKKIFQPFQQGDSSSTREHGGSGLGLAISKNLVEQMGGTIRVKSREGEGSVFTFDIPDPAEAAKPVPASDIRTLWQGKTICVWTDDPADMRTAEVLLERCGVMPRYKTNIDEIEEDLTGELEAGAVLCNLDMPGLAGQLVAFRKIRPAVPWIGVSNWINPLDDRLNPCFSAFIDRPLRPEQLYGVLLKLAGNRPARS
jgi:PAS domain S-box-containing protein